jgi:soluble lytic murein transglycosylase-like protein
VTRALRLGGLAIAASVLVGAAPVEAQLVRIVDQDGVVHYTNEPCQPQYRRLAPDACPEARPASQAEAATMPIPASPPLAREIERAAARHGVDPRLVEAVVRVESGGNSAAVSPKGAQGLMQLMPARAAALGVRDVFDPVANLDGGVRHLRDLLARYAGNLSLALAAYNAGEAAVRAHSGIPPYPETREYVRKVLAFYGAERAPARLPQPKPGRLPL